MPFAHLKATIPGLTLSVMLFASYGFGQPHSARTAAELIDDLRLLGHQKKPEAPILSFFSCAEPASVRGERAIASELAQLGQAAIPDIGRALDLVEKQGQKSRLYGVAGWLLFADADIEGPAAIPRFTGMLRNPELASQRRNLDNAIALSLGITSYVSSLREREGVSSCPRRWEPKDALDHLIMSLEHNDRDQFESSVGPRAQEVLRRAPDGGSWDTIRGRVWRVHSTEPTAVGYKFDLRGRWSEPWETLEEERGYGDAPLISERVTLDTRFKDASGRDCARDNVEFLRVLLPGGAVYKVDNANIEDLLLSIGGCAAQ